MSSSKTTPAKSKIWEYFTLLEVDKEGKLHTECKEENCKRKLAYHGSTTSMITHLESKHPDKHKEFQGKDSKQDPSALQQGSLASETFKIKELSMEKKRFITGAIANFIAMDMRPIQLVEGIGFQRLIKLLEPRYTIPCRKTFSQNVIPKKYEELKNKLNLNLTGVDAYSITFDYWTSCCSKSFLSLTMHHLTQDFQLKDYVLKTQEVNVSHTAKNTSDIIRTILSEFNLPLNKVWTVSDGAANMKATAKELGYPNILCFAHLLHGCLTNIFDDPQLKTLLANSRGLVKHFRSSTQNTYALTEIQEKMNLPQLKLKLDNNTRWNTVYEMVSRLIVNRVALTNLALKEKEVEKLIFSNEEWQTLTNLKQVLEPFKTMTDTMSTSSTVSLSLIKPFIIRIYEQILDITDRDNENIKYLKEKLKEEFILKTRKYEKVEDLLTIATLLDPRMKQFVLRDEHEWRKANDLLSAWYKDYKLDMNSNASQDNANTQHRSGLYTIFGCPRLPQAQVDGMTRELNAYLGENDLELDKDPLEYWRLNGARFPVLRRIALHVLAIPGTSVPSERLFSKAGQIINTKRANLNSKLADKLIFFAHNNKKILL